MRIGIDARFYGPRVGGGGLGRYVEELVRHVAQLDQENEYVIFLRRENWDDYTPTASNFKKVLAPWRWYTLAEQFGMPAVLREAGLDLLHVPHFNIPLFSRVPLVVTIHDLILLEYPSIRATTLDPIRFWLKFIGYRFVIGAALRRARRIIAVSDATRQAILKRFPSVLPERVVVVHPGFTPPPSHSERSEESPTNVGSHTREILRLTQDDSNEIATAPSAPRDDTTHYSLLTTHYLLTVGNAYPHKNLEGLIRAFADLNRPGLKLVITGPDDFFRARLRELARELGATDRIIFTGFVDEATLDALYENATAYIVPSHLEGFAFPGLEAQSRGTPVLASDIPAHREVFADGARYFSPTPFRTIRDAIIDFLDHPEIADSLRTKGFENYKRFDWLNSAQKTINIYRSCTK